ncbi:TRAP transporter small permease subunit [Rhodobacter sp.]
MTGLLAFSRLIDAISTAFGKVAEYLVLACCLISAGNAVVRKVYPPLTSNAWLEIQWYMFGFIVLLGAAYTLKNNEHVRVDLIYGAVSDRKRLWIDIFGIIFFLLPFATYAGWISWPMFWSKLMSGEMSGNAGGLIRWPVWLTITGGFWLLALQAVSELIKRIAALTGAISLETTYEKPLQ